MEGNFGQRVSAFFKKWWILVVVIIVLIILAIPAGYVINMHNSVYDCSFQYEKYDNPLMEIAKKHMYYNASNKTVEIELNQDFINSIIKDTLETMDLGLPEKVSVNEVMLNTKDQRVYVNAKYGSINVPVSAKINISITDSGLEITGDDIMLGKKNAPGFVKKRVPQEILHYSINLNDYEIPQVFSLKEIKFGSGTVKAIIQLDAEKVADLVMDYYKEGIAGEVDKFKNSQSGIAAIIVNDVLETGILSEAKVREYVLQALDNEELVNSAIYFATAENLTKYTDSFQKAQQQVTDFATEWVADFTAPFKTIKLDGTVDEIVESILYNDELKGLLTMFVPTEEIDKYTASIEEYLAMYKDYLGMYEDLLASLDRSIAGIDTKKLSEDVKTLQDYAMQVKDLRDFLVESIQQIDPKKVEQLVTYLENDDGYGKEFISSIDPDTYDLVRKYLINASSTKSYWIENLQAADLSLADDFSDVLGDRKDFTLNVIKDLKSHDFERAFGKLSGDGIVGKKTQNFIDKVYNQVDLSIAEFDKNF